MPTIATMLPLLDQINSALESPNGAKLWAILSALRGPDDDSDHEGKDLTVCIRSLAFPASVHFSSPTPPPQGVARVTLQNFVNNRDRLDSHFYNHIASAAAAFGIYRTLTDR